MRILVFQHLDVEHPGIFRDFWKEDGHQWDAVELDAGKAIPPLEDYDLLVVMGGPQDVWQEDIHPWFIPEKAAIRRWVMELKRPYLGVCLGHQLLAEALGGKVTPMQMPEVGLADVAFTPEGKADPLLAGLGEGVLTFQWHGAEISTMPEGAVILAKNPACATQAIRWGDHAYGLQYHVEITPTTVPDWESVPAYAESLQVALGPEKAARLQETVAPRLADFGQTARTLYDNFSRILAVTADRKVA